MFKQQTYIYSTMYKKNIHKNAIAVTAVVFLLSSCTTTGNIEKSKIGAAVGVIAGATAGALLIDDNRAAGAAIGALLGGGAGYILGNMLDERDKASLKAKIDEAANNNPDSKPTIWCSDHSGTCASISIMDSPSTIESTMSIPAESDITTVSKTLTNISGKRWAAANVNVRTGPGTSYPIKFVLREGKETSVIGTTDNGWSLIGENGIAVGYVDDYYLQASKNKENSKKSNSNPKEKSIIFLPKNKEAPSRVVKSAKEADVRISRICRSSKVLIKRDDGQIVEELVPVCQKSDGSWGA